MPKNRHSCVSIPTDYLYILTKSLAAQSAHQNYAVLPKFFYIIFMTLSIREMICLISVQNYTKKYGDKTVVNDISFTAKDGAITGFIGHN